MTNRAKKIWELGRLLSIDSCQQILVWALFAIFDFFGLKKGCDPTGTPISLGPQNPTKKLTHLVDLLGHLLSRQCACFSGFQAPGRTPVHQRLFKEFVTPRNAVSRM